MNRRRLITGLAAVLAMPAVVQASALMPVKGDRFFVWDWHGPLLPDIGPRWEAAYKTGTSFEDYAKPWLSPRGHIYEGVWTFFGKDRNIYSDTQICFRKIEIIPE